MTRPERCCRPAYTAHTARAACGAARPRALPRGGERGSALIEALAAIVLSAIIGLGLTYVATQALKNQRNAATQTQAVAQMREAFNVTGVSSLCEAQSPEAFDVGRDDMQQVLPTATCSTTVVTVGVSGHTDLTVQLSASSAMPTAIRLSTPSGDASRALFGGDGQVSVGY